MATDINSTGDESLPKITAHLLIANLIEQGVLKDTDIVALLGANRLTVTVSQLETALFAQNKMSDGDIIDLKARISSYAPFYGDVAEIDPERLPIEISKKTGILALRKDPTSIVLAEDLPQNLEIIAAKLGVAVSELAISITSVSVLKATYRALTHGAVNTELPVTKDIFEIFDDAVKKNASDIHLSVGKPPTLRVDGGLRQMPRQPISALWMQEEMERIAGKDRLEIALKHYDVDFAFQYGEARFRCNVGADRYGLTLAARKLPTKIPTPEDLRLPRSVTDFKHLDRGMVLVTGPTGSGKSTTLAAILNQICKEQDRHLITLEDPIEFVLPQDGKSTVHQRELGGSFTTFSGGLRQALRQDPDIVLVGELRDIETMRTAVMAAETGHLVFGTLHTYDAASTIARLVNSFPADEQEQIRAQLAYILKGIVSQTLLVHSSGRGRVAAYEVMITNPAIANNLRKVDGHAQIKGTIEVSKREGMQTMDMALANLVKKGLVTQSDAESKARDIEDFHSRLSSED
jgi:twitching motility protein PilT